MVLGGTPQFLEDPRRGLFGYEALRSRLCDSRFNDDEFRNLIGPVIRLRRLSDDELFALIVRVTALYAQHYRWEPRITSDQQIRFLNSGNGLGKILFQGFYSLSCVEDVKMMLREQDLQIIRGLEGDRMLPLGAAVDNQYVH